MNGSDLAQRPSFACLHQLAVHLRNRDHQNNQNDRHDDQQFQQGETTASANAAARQRTGQAITILHTYYFMTWKNCETCSAG